jgi:hypothetical protein
MPFYCCTSWHCMAQGSAADAHVHPGWRGRLVLARRLTGGACSSREIGAHMLQAPERAHELRQSQLAWDKGRGGCSVGCRAEAAMMWSRLGPASLLWWRSCCRMPHAVSTAMSGRHTWLSHCLYHCCSGSVSHALRHWRPLHADSCATPSRPPLQQQSFELSSWDTGCPAGTQACKRSMHCKALLPLCGTHPG